MIFKDYKKRDKNSIPKEDQFFPREDEATLGMFAGDIIEEYRIHWLRENNKPKPVRCIGKESGCTYCSQDTGKKVFRAYFVYKDPDTGERKIGIYEGNEFTYNFLGEMNETHPLGEYVLKVQKKLVPGYDKPMDRFEIFEKASPQQKEACMSFLPERTQRDPNHEDAPFEDQF